MATTGHIGTSERRARLGIRHRLAAGTQVSSIAEAASSMVVLHATDSPSVFLQARARMTAATVPGIEREMYDERTVLRMLSMRRTLFLVPLAEVPIVNAAASRAISAIERRRSIAMLTGGGIGPDPEALLEELETVVLAAVRENDGLTTADLKGLDARLGQRITTAPGKPWQGSISVSTRVALQLAVDGRIGRDRPRGTWIGSQFRWSPIERWLPDGIAVLPVETARAELVRRWLRTFGPGTRDDIRWWTGWTVAATRQALAAVGAVEVGLDGGETGYVLPADMGPADPPDPWVALLPALDPTTMGWTRRDWYLGPHRPLLFDTSGNAGPTIWVDGRIVGGWAQLGTGEVVPRLLEDVGRETEQAIEAEAARLRDWLGATRVTGRFPVTLQIEEAADSV